MFIPNTNLQSNHKYWIDIETQATCRVAHCCSKLPVNNNTAAANEYQYSVVSTLGSLAFLPCKLYRYNLYGTRKGTDFHGITYFDSLLMIVIASLIMYSLSRNPIQHIDKPCKGTSNRKSIGNQITTNMPCTQFSQIFQWNYHCRA